MSKTSVNGERKNSLKSKESLNTDLRTNSKGSSVQAMSKTSQEDSKISRSRRSSRSVSFSSPLQHFPDAAKQRKESVDRLTKRRSSQKVAKKASNKELKKRRSSSNEHVKGKTKSTTEVAAKVDSNRKVSNASISKSHTKTHRKSSKNVVIHKTKSEAKTKPEDAQETRVEDSQETRVEDTQGTSVDESQGTHVEDSQEIHVDDAQEMGKDNTQETRAEGSQETLVKDSQETRVDDTQGTREGSDDNLRKTESDEEVVVQVYVPDEGQADVPEQVTEQTSQESGDKAEHTGTGRRNVVTTEVASNVTKIDLKVFPQESSVKRGSSRRAFGDNVVEKNLVNIVPRNSMDIIKGFKLTPDTKVTPNRSFHSKSNLHRAPVAPKPGTRVTRRTHPEARAIKVSNFELPEAGQGGATLKPTQHGKAQMSMHRLASKMSTNLEKVDEGSALETGLSSKESGKFLTALNISKAGVKTQKPTSSETEKDDLVNSQEKTEKPEENVETKTEKVYFIDSDIFNVWKNVDNSETNMLKIVHLQGGGKCREKWE
ncbi:Hypothetical predicted protein [Paramuricea clavata]|uniref:Uncharacterized protein n=1 Tax=Paramuricea clavata TaxID=317549 RepID=A0A6S7GIN5_PARCT|nr:Hypothetical predicted protein [Paramuricea clavata]